MLLRSLLPLLPLLLLLAGCASLPPREQPSLRPGEIPVVRHRRRYPPGTSWNPTDREHVEDLDEHDLTFLANYRPCFKRHGRGPVNVHRFATLVCTVFARGYAIDVFRDDAVETDYEYYAYFDGAYWRQGDEMHCLFAPRYPPEPVGNPVP